MRTKDMLLDKFENIKILYQYLYMSEEHKILIHNSINVPLEIHMDENLHFWCKNLNFPDIDPMLYDSTMNLNTVLDIIEILKETKAIELPNVFANRWEEIRAMTASNCALNRPR